MEGRSNIPFRRTGGTDSHVDDGQRGETDGNFVAGGTNVTFHGDRRNGRYLPWWPV